MSWFVVVRGGLMSWFVVVRGGFMSWFVVVRSGSWWFVVPPPLIPHIHTYISVQLLSTCLAVWMSVK